MRMEEGGWMEERGKRVGGREEEKVVERVEEGGGVSDTLEMDEVERESGGGNWG
jgi:hypothetical protein